MKKLTLTLIAALCFAGAASSAPPPRTATFAGTQASALRHQLQVVKRQRHYLAIGCFHVAPRQWVCPLPAPKRSDSVQMNDGGGSSLPACGGSYVGTYFVSAGHEYFCSYAGSRANPSYWTFIW